MEYFYFIDFFRSNKTTHSNQIPLTWSSLFSFRQPLPSSIISKAMVFLDWFLYLFFPSSLFLDHLILAYNEINNLICQAFAEHVGILSDFCVRDCRISVDLLPCKIWFIHCFTPLLSKIRPVSQLEFIHYMYITLAQPLLSLPLYTSCWRFHKKQHKFIDKLVRLVLNPFSLFIVKFFINAKIR